jgi:hypothetical protein
MFILRMKNLSLSLGAPLSWPQDVEANLPVGFPTTPAGLQQMSSKFILILKALILVFVPTVQMCDSISAALGLPAVAAHTSVAQRREWVMIHLGCLQLSPSIPIDP